MAIKLGLNSNFLGSFLDDMNLMNKAPKEIDKEIKHWDVLLFKKLFSKSLDEWRIELYAKFEDKKANFNDVKDLDCSLFEGLFDSFFNSSIFIGH